MGVCYFLKLGCGYVAIYFCHPLYLIYTYHFIYIKYFNRSNFLKFLIIKFRFDSLGSSEESFKANQKSRYQVTVCYSTPQRCHSDILSKRAFEFSEKLQLSVIKKPGCQLTSLLTRSFEELNLKTSIFLSNGLIVN